MPATLPAPWVPLGFPSLVAAGGQTAFTGGQTTLGIETDDQIALSSSQTTPRTEAGGHTATPCGQIAHPLIAPSSAASPTSAAPRAALTTPAVPSAAPTSPHYSRHPRAAREPPTPPLLQ
jgi:hypothetical protein